MVLVNLQDGSLVATAITIIRGRPDGHQTLVKVELEPFVHKLMRTANKLEPVHAAELLRHLAAEEPASTTLRDLPSVNVGLRVRPHQVAEGALVRRLLMAINEAQLVQRRDFRGETAMNAEDSSVDDA